LPTVREPVPLAKCQSRRSGGYAERGQELLAENFSWMDWWKPIFVCHDYNHLSMIIDDFDGSAAPFLQIKQIRQ
jgi:hypothetical protein